MPNLSKQRQLAIANRHIAEAQARIAQQAQAVRQLKADGRDTTAAQDLLGVLRQSLDAMNAHREQSANWCTSPARLSRISACPHGKDRRAMRHPGQRCNRDMQSSI